MAVEPLQIETVVDRVYAVLRARIATGELVRGTKLRQEALAEELGVSRTPLREALRRLAAEGLVEFHPHRGARVAELQPKDIRAAYEARLAFEPGAARLAAARRPASEIAAMHDAIDDQRRRGRTERAYVASRAFHLALVRAAGNDHLVRFAEALWAPGLAEAIYERQTANADALRDDVAEHLAIVAAIEAGDEDAAATLTRTHIAAALGILLSG
jgi:DNA-binding GntR family transcriptional regulator